MDAPPRAAWRAAGLAAALTLAALLLLAGRGDGVVLGGGGGDFPSIAWGLWRVDRALPGLPPLHSDLIFFPQGASLLIADLPGALIVAPVARLLGPVAAFNALQALHVLLAAALGALLAHDIGGRPSSGTPAATVAAAVGGLALGLSPALLSSLHNGNPDVTPVFLVPLAAICLRRLAARPSAGWLAAAALCIGLSPWFNPYVGVMVALTALVVARWRSPWTLAAGALSLLLASGYAALTWQSLAQADTIIHKPALPPGVPSPGAAHLAGFLWPAAELQPDGWSVHAWFPGYSVLALALLAGGGAWRWWLLAGLGGLLSLGPVLQLSAGIPLEVAGTRLALPWAGLPILSSLQIQYRFAALASAALGVLAAQGAGRLGPRLAWVALLVVLAELAVWAAPLVRGGPVPASVEVACALLRGRPPAPVLDLPGEREERRMLAQTCHGMPVAEGINQPYPHRVRQALDESDPFAALAALGFGYLLLHEETGPLTPPAERRRAADLAAAAARQGRILEQRGGISLVDLTGSVP